MKKVYYTLLLLLSQIISAQQEQEMIGTWNGWYREGQRIYEVWLNIDKSNGIYYEGDLTLKFNDEDVTFSIEGYPGDNDSFNINERDIINHHSPGYIKNPQWCKADYTFAFSDLGDRFQLKGFAKVPSVNIAYINGKKVYNSPRCKYFNPSEIKLQRKNPAYKGEVKLETKPKREVYVRLENENTFEAISDELFRQPQNYKKVLLGGTIEENKKTISPSNVDKAVIHTPKIDPIEKRSNVESEVIESTNKLAQISVWDDKEVDGDIISIFHNGKLIQKNINLLKTPSEFSISLEEGKNVIAMYSVSMGKTPPNSAAMKIKTGSKTYSLNLISDTEKNGTVVIYYYPKK